MEKGWFLFCSRSQMLCWGTSNFSSFFYTETWHYALPSSWGRGFQIQPDYQTHVPFMASSELGLRMGNLIYRGLNRGESEHLNNHPLTLECSGLCCLSCQVQLILSSCQPLTSAALPRDTALWRVIRVTPLRVVGKSSASAPGWKCPLPRCICRGAGDVCLASLFSWG